jgi:uncharacterized membrane protein
MDALYSATVLGSTVYQICWLFLIYSFLGVLIEGIFCLAVEGVLEARLGLLYLPLRPMYGAGGVACALLLDRFLDQPIWVFLFGMLICTVVEYVAGLAMEKAFGTVSWDYCDKPLNLHGRICLQYSVCWGLLALLVVYAVDPVVTDFVGLPGHQSTELALTALVTVTLLSTVVTMAAWARVRKRVTALRQSMAGQAPTGSDTTRDRLLDRLAPDRVLINNFPRMRLMIELMELTRAQRPQLTLPRHPGRTLSPPPGPNEMSQLFSHSRKLG